MNQPSRYDGVTEKEWQTQVMALLKYRGYRTYHTHDSRRSTAGFPDVVAVNAAKRDTLVLELKTERGKVSAEQLAWLAEFTSAGIEARVVRPSDIDWLIQRTRLPPSQVPQVEAVEGGSE